MYDPMLQPLEMQPTEVFYKKDVAYNFFKKETRVLSCGFWKSFKNTFLRALSVDCFWWLQIYSLQE